MLNANGVPGLNFKGCPIWFAAGGTLTPSIMNIIGAKDINIPGGGIIINPENYNFNDPVDWIVKFYIDFMHELFDQMQ
jgi:hypothetical protein